MLPLHSDEELDDIGARLAESGALALLLVEVEPLGRIEWRYGTQAYEAAMNRLLAVVREIAHDALPEKDVFVTVEQGGDTILAFLFRPRSDRAFYTAGLQELRDHLALELRDHLALNLFHRGKNAVYPYHREPLSLGLGGAIALYNPNVKPARQILKAVEIARRDALLEAGLRARERSVEILQLILQENLVTRYEPIVEIATRRPIGYEALTRGPEDSLLHTPERLFSQAQEVGDCLCRRLAFENASCIPRGAKLFLNCLPAAIGDPNLRDDGLRANLEKYQLEPENLVIEISERESIENFAIFRELRDAYHELGVRIAIDDAGAGYASLQAIMEIAPDYMKADMALVRGIDTDPPRREVVKGLRGVAERIGAEVIAEGIETEEELRVMRELGIRFGQGYIFGPPLPRGS
jgi:EAL domain-containing protein (putative c-di-GMP-specific phosphodiesterase class I)